MCFINQTFRLIFIASFAFVDFTIAKTLRSLQETQHTARVSLNFFGAPDLLSEEDINELSNVFKEAYGTYEDLTIQDVHIDDSTASRRRLLLNNERRLDDAPLQFDFTFFFLINFQCNGCNNDGLYQNDGSRRRLAADKRPKRSTFTKRFNKLLRRQGLDFGVSSLNLVSDLETEQCMKKEADLSEKIEIKFKGNYDALINDRREMASLERAVKKSYNTMNAPNPSTCDLLFRKVVSARYRSVTIISEDTFIMIFSIQYDCQGCRTLSNGERRGLFGRPVDEFDNGREDLNVDLREVDLKEPTCVCGREADLYRGTTRTEYIRALRKILDVRSDQGKNSYITGVSRTFSSSMASS
mmetsp:Transcript_16810/g.24883  ORF Transcript_16810/g.24883 Transcript_16810/m.24883 type:complete len:355 (-) Transcript_16810:67-1131(-)